MDSKPSTLLLLNLNQLTSISELKEATSATGIPSQTSAGGPLVILRGKTGNKRGNKGAHLMRELLFAASQRRPPSSEDTHSSALASTATHGKAKLITGSTRTNIIHKLLPTADLPCAAAVPCSSPGSRQLQLAI